MLKIGSTILAVFIALGVGGCDSPRLTNEQIVQLCTDAGNPPGDPGYNRCHSRYEGPNGSGGTAGVTHMDVRPNFGRWDRY